MKWLVRLYPRAWRDRYAAELTDLIDDLDAGPGVAIDLVRGAAVERLRSLLRVPESTLRLAGGLSMTEYPWRRHPTALALVALVIVLPSLAFLTASVLAYQLEVPWMLAALEPILQAMTGPRVVDLFLLGAPCLAFVIAIAPLVGGSVSRTDGESRITLRVGLRPLNLAVMALTVFVGGSLVIYIVTEFLLEAAR